jgi:uncharacterized protein YoxC
MPPQSQQEILNQVVDQVKDFNRRVRDLEEKVRNLTARVNNLDDSLLDKTKNLSDDIQEVNDEIAEVRDRMANLEVDIKEINRERRRYVTDQEIEEIENYMDLMNPINSSFVTKKEAEKMIDEKKGEELMTKRQVEKLIERKLKKERE